MILYHGTNSKFNKFSYDYIGKGNDQYGPGFYMVSDPGLTRGYGNNVTKWEVDTSKVKDKKWLHSKADYRLFSSLIKEAPNLEDKLSNFGYPAMTVGMQNAIKWIITDHSNDNFDVLQAVWWDFYRHEPEIYIQKLVQKGIDGILINTKEDSRGLIMPGDFYIMYNPDKIKFIDNQITESLDSNGYIYDRDILKYVSDIYDELNTKLYNGKMPKIEFALKKSARVGASTESLINRATGLTRPTKITVSTHWRWTEKNLRSVMGHEMIHVWQSVEQKLKNARNGGHDWGFKSEMERINKLMPGLNVTLEHENAVTSSDTTVKTAAIIFEKDNGEFSIVACRMNDLERIKDKVEKGLKDSKNYTKRGGTLHIVPNAGGEAAKYPKSVKTIKFYKVSDIEAKEYLAKSLGKIEI